MFKIDAVYTARQILAVDPHAFLHFAESVGGYRRETLYAVIPAAGAGLLPVAYEFDRISSGKFQCQGLGRPEARNVEGLRKDEYSTKLLDSLNVGSSSAIKIILDTGPQRKSKEQVANALRNLADQFENGDQPLSVTDQDGKVWGSVDWL